MMGGIQQPMMGGMQQPMMGDMQQPMMGGMQQPMMGGMQQPMMGGGYGNPRKNKKHGGPAGHDGNKHARREYGHGGKVDGEMPKAKPC